MLGKTLVSVAVLGLFLGFGPMASADFDDFIDMRKVDAKMEACTGKWADFVDRCNNPNPTTETKCLGKAASIHNKCQANARKNAINFGDLPPDAQREYAKIAVKHDQVSAKCLKTAEKGLVRCAMRYSKDEAREDVCDDQVKNKQATCLENMFDRYTFRSKTMVRLLRGQQP